MVLKPQNTSFGVNQKSRNVNCFALFGYNKDRETVLKYDARVLYLPFGIIFVS